MDSQFDSTLEVWVAEGDRREDLNEPQMLRCVSCRRTRWQVYVQGARSDVRRAQIRTYSKLPEDSVLLIDRVVVKPSRLPLED